MRTMHRFHRSRRFPLGFLLLVPFVSFASAAHAQRPSLTKLEAEYQSEANPVRQAKLLAKLGPMEVDQASRNFQDDKDDAAFAVLERLRNNVRKTTEALSASQPNATRHPAGYKELQIGLREALRRMNDLSSEVPIDEEDRFETLRMDLTETQNSLMEALFPSSKEKRSKDGKAD